VPKAPKAPRGVDAGKECPPPRRGGIWGGDRPLSKNFVLLLDLKMEHFGDVFKLDLTEETRTQLQKEEAVASYWLRLWW